MVDPMRHDIKWFEKIRRLTLDNPTHNYGEDPFGRTGPLFIYHGKTSRKNFS